MYFESTVITHGYLISRGTFVGFYLDPSRTLHSFIRDKHGVFSEIEVPGAISSSARGINPQGDIVGAYMEASRRVHGYLMIRAGGADDDGGQP